MSPQKALEKYLEISRQWNGKGEGKPITVAEGNKILGGITQNMCMPQPLRIKAGQLQQDIIMNNHSSLTPQQEISSNG